MTSSRGARTMTRNLWQEPRALLQFVTRRLEESSAHWRLKANSIAYPEQPVSIKSCAPPRYPEICGQKRNVPVRRIRIPKGFVKVRPAFGRAVQTGARVSPRSPPRFARTSACSPTGEPGITTLVALRLQARRACAQVRRKATPSRLERRIGVCANPFQNVGRFPREELEPLDRM